MADAEKTKRENLSKILKNGRGVWVAYDHGMEHGPKDFNGFPTDPHNVVRELSPLCEGFLMNYGIAKLTKDELKCPLILKLTGRTSVCQVQMQRKIAGLGEAIELGATAVAATVYVGENREDEMLAQFAGIRQECSMSGLPILGLMYPRGPNIVNPNAWEIVSYAARVGAELGADIVKTYWTGSSESFSRVTKVTPVPIMVAGGPQMAARDSLVMVSEIVKAGAAGIAVGRNVWQHENPVGMLKAIRAIVHEGKGVEEALKIVG